MMGLEKFPVPSLFSLTYIFGTQHYLFVPTERHRKPKVDHINFERGEQAPFFTMGWGAWPDWPPWIRQCSPYSVPPKVSVPSSARFAGGGGSTP